MPSEDLELALRCEAAELAASRSHHAALSPAVAKALGAGARPLGAGQLMYANADVLTSNFVLGLGVAEPATERELDEALRFFAERGTARCMLALAPFARPEALALWLEARGFTKHNHWIRLARDASPVAAPKTDLRIAPFGPEREDEFGRMVGEAFKFPVERTPVLSCAVGQPGWRHFGAFDGEALVAAGAIFVDGDAAWFGTAATRATHRGRGAQSAIIAARVNAAHEAGCRLIAVETAADTKEKPNPSTHNLRRLGFRDLYERANWVKVFGPG